MYSLNLKKSKNNIIAKIGISVILLVTFISNICFADWIRENNRYRYLNSSTGQYVVNNWLQTGNGFYFFDSNGYAVTGWYLINDKYYYFNQDGLMQTGFQEINGTKYYLDATTGVMVTGWVQTYTDGVLDYYYFLANGEMAKGWQQINNQWYYFWDGKCITDTFAKINDLWYHFSPAGTMDTGWVNRSGKMYYFSVTNGAMTKGWIQDQNGNEYYLSEADGSLAIGTTIMIGGKSYTFDSTGKCIAKDVSSYAGDINGNTNSLMAGYLGNKGDQIVYGVNVGVSPGSNYVNGITGTEYQRQISSPLEAGSTAGPK